MQDSSSSSRRRRRRIKLFKLLNKQEEEEEEEKRIENKLIVLFRPENTFYLTNFWGEGITIISEENIQTKLVVPKLEYTRAINTSKECDVISSDRGITIINTLMNLIKEGDIVFSDSNDFDIINKIQKKIGNKNVVIDSKLLYSLREIKDTEEINNIKIASKTIDKLFEIALKEIKENMITEEQIQSILVYEAMKLGARFPSYPYTSNPLIVASGPNGSFPHAETSNKKIKSGELIVIDLTLSFNHYVSDATRTFGLGNITKEMKEVYETVKISQENGIEYIKKTSDFSDIDACCRNTITNKQWGEYFIHSTGHGIGLEVHEPPWIRPNFKNKIKENMTITIEPGIYIENKLGVRIEDSLLITKKGNRDDEFDSINFHSFSKELFVL
ncbi:MAG: M24 family metallopeptidase [Candidatus Nitrosocosmicus sp.]